MLTNGIKKKIDNCRDILVGKLPDPKSQIEQITIALIYKFMNDIDNDSVELGGSASFFKGEFSKYKWSNIVDVKLNGYERLNLYAEAIDKMNVNSKIPQLFRDIFKNAFLPYRDPETFTLFAKEINEFHYEHSEELGNAFEYLLSIMSSQGDAGQFRTPRNIIDFMVRVIQPQKNESILDPACGTAGFLISAYKYIKELSKDITPDEHKKLTKNIVGYDISPDMVRLSLVNLYLHSFPDPKIYEYDTLTSEDRWKDTFDIIMANPPFMTPKGGIKPHNKFAIKVNRSEVLFVDYIMEHLNLNGRAAVIVPEGIIFQSANAYKTLRKKLVEDNYLWAVVSLPAGVFNPYSGVKTSILFMDRNIAKQTDKILFIKIENDGFGLGAQRREIEKNDLPEALNAIEEYRKAIYERKLDSEKIFRKQGVATPCFHLMIEKSKLAENEYNLTGERYRISERKGHQKWPMVKLRDVCEFIRGVTYNKKDEIDIDGIEILRANNINLNSNKLDLSDIKLINKKLKFSDKQKLKKDDIFICTASGSKDHIGKVAYINEDTDYYFGGFMGVIRTKTDKLLSKFLFDILKDSKFNNYLRNSIAAVNINNLNSSILNNFQILLPPLEVQQEIVAEIDGYQKVIDGANQVVDNWKPQIDIDPEWPMVKLGEVCSFMTGGTPTSNVKKYYENGTIPWLVSGDIHKGEIFDCEGKITKLGMDNSNAKILPKDSILIALNGQGKTRGTVALLRMDNATCNQSIVSINPNNQKKLLSSFIYYQMKSMYQQIRNITGDNQRSGLNITIIKSIEIPLPPLEDQLKIVEKIEEERKAAEGCKKLIAIYEGKIKNVIDKVWEE